MADLFLEEIHLGLQHILSAVPSICHCYFWSATKSAPALQDDAKNLPQIVGDFSLWSPHHHRTAPEFWNHLEAGEFGMDQHGRNIRCKNIEIVSECYEMVILCDWNGGLLSKYVKIIVILCAKRACGTSCWKQCHYFALSLTAPVPNFESSTLCSTRSSRKASKDILSLLSFVSLSSFDPSFDPFDPFDPSFPSFPSLPPIWGSCFRPPRSEGSSSRTSRSRKRQNGPETSWYHMSADQNLGGLSIFGGGHRSSIHLPIIRTPILEWMTMTHIMFWPRHMHSSYVNVHWVKTCGG